MYGTLADFDRLVAEAKKRGIRIVLDFVMNHTSDQHKWFLDSGSTRTSAHRDWYIWRDGKGPNEPPNNWYSTFGGSAWTFDPRTGQYYYHYFFLQQPDLNWRNPAVEKAMFDAMRFWYKRGVAGFRLDAVDTLFEDPELRDNPILPVTDKFGRPRMENKFNNKLPEVHEELKKLRKVADEYGAVLIGETFTSSIEELKKYYGEHGDELQMPMDFMFTNVNKLSAPEFRKQIAAIDSSGGWPVYLLSNHDIVRSYNRYGDGVHKDEIAKLMAALYLTLRGTPIVYYGEEIGMENNDPKTRDEVKDPIGRLGWPKEKGRDGERTPMQWNDARNAGFSVASPWSPVPPSYKTHNVSSEQKDPNSILSFYRKLLALRHKEAALWHGDYVALSEENPSVLAYLRRYQAETILVALNMSGLEQDVRLDLSRFGYPAPKLEPLLTDLRTPPAAPGRLTLDAFSVIIARVVK